MQISIRAGNAMPNIDKHKAPKSEMNKLRYGIAIANKTETENI